MERREERRASFVLHIDGILKDAVLFKYVGGKNMPLIVGRRTKYRDFDNLIHSKIGTNRSEVSLFIKCRYILDPSQIVLYDIRDEDDLELIMMLFASTFINYLSLYVTKEFRFRGNNSPDPTNVGQPYLSANTEAVGSRVECRTALPTLKNRCGDPPGGGRHCHGHTSHRYGVEFSEVNEDPICYRNVGVATIPSSFAEASRPNISTIPVFPAAPSLTAVAQKERFVVFIPYIGKL
ncbi:uncharacterized protein LOC143885480 [Tasmannia lanceolata]|uniref:uncharacterized protein LOC143885480 n=1 Tax=Tasmannia lanceolata TaxID=3420 RepID=UPI0040639F57